MRGTSCNAKGSLGIVVIKHFWYAEVTESTEKEWVLKGFSVKSA